MSDTIRLFALVEAVTVTGPAKNLIDFCRTARDCGMPVDATLATFDRTGKNEFAAAARAAGFPAVVLNERRAFDRGVIDQLKRAIANAQPDIVQTHGVKAHFLVRHLGLWRNRAWIAFHHGYTTTDLKDRAYSQLDRWSLRKATRLITVSEAFKRQLIHRGLDGPRIMVLQNAVDPAWVARFKTIDRLAFRRQLGINPEEKVILAAGRMSAEKAHIDLVTAFRLFREHVPAARLVLVGDGPERRALEQAANGQPVLFTGHVRDMAPYYAIADVMALPSLTEGSPNVLLEAMACGVPSVATSVGGVPEIVTNEESALLVPPREPQRLAAALQRILTDPQLGQQLAARAADLIRDRHVPEARARQLVAVYTSVVNRSVRMAS